MKEEKIIESLVKDGVTIVTKKYAEIEGESYLIEQDSHTYGNWKEDRANLARDEPEDIANTILSYWGDSPTLVNPALAVEAQEGAAD